MAPFIGAMVGVFCLLSGAVEVRAKQAPQRIISLNLCTDQLLMMLVKPSRIAALSYLARQPEISALASKAAHLPITYGKAEEVFILKPDLVLVGSFTPRTTVNLLRKLNKNIVEVPPAAGFDAIARNIALIGAAVREGERAAKLISKLKAELGIFETDGKSASPLAALYFANGYSSGINTLADGVVQKGGFKTLGQKLQFKGTRKISLEALIFANPDVMVVEQKRYRGGAMAYEVFKHPALRLITSRAKTTSIATALTICGTPKTIEAAKSLRQFRNRHFSSGKPNEPGKNGQ